MRRRGFLVLIVALLFASYVFYSLMVIEPVRVTRSAMVRRGDQVSVEGELHNTGEEVGALEIEIRYFDGSGRRLGTDTISVNDLKQGATSGFRGPPHNLAPGAGYSIFLNHGRNAYGN